MREFSKFSLFLTIIIWVIVMKCRICDNFFYIKRRLLTLFNTDKEYICNSCYKKFPIALSYEAIALDKYHCLILSIFKHHHKIDYNLFFKEYSKIFLASLKRRGYEIVFLDFIDLTDDTFEILDCISKLVKSNIIVLTFNARK